MNNMGIFDRFKQAKTEAIEGYQSFSTPFGKIGNANLSLPYVNGRYQVAGYIPFGQDNLFPETLNQLYFTSPLHGAIVDFKVNATIGAGYQLKTDKLTPQEKLDLYTWEKKMKLAKSVRLVAKQLVLHNRVYFMLHFDEKHNVKRIENISPEKVRINRAKDCYFLCDDWASRIDVLPVTKYHPLNTDKCQIYAYELPSIGQDFYSLPTYSSALNFAFLSGELSYFAKSNIQNSIFPAFAMMFPKRPQSEEEKKVLRDTIDRMKGAQNAGKGVAFFANSPDQLPKIESIPTNQNDKLFQEASGLNTEQICFAHTIDPILMGVRTTGSLGGGADIKQAYVIFEKNVVIPLREMVEEVFAELLAICKLKADFTIKNFQIINETIVERDEKTLKIVDSLNTLDPSIAQKVIEQMTPDELRSLAGLLPLEKTTPQTPTA
jgi:capsid portal protein